MVAADDDDDERDLPLWGTVWLDDDEDDDDDDDDEDGGIWLVDGEVESDDDVEWVENWRSSIVLGSKVTTNGVLTCLFTLHSCLRPIWLDEGPNNGRGRA